MSEESIKPPNTSDNSLAPKLIYIHNVKIVVKSEASCFKQNITSFNRRYVTNCLRIRYVAKIFTHGIWTRWFIVSDSNKYESSAYGIGFDTCYQFSLPISEWRRNVVIFGVGKSLSRHTGNRKKEFLVLGEKQTNGLDDTTVTAKAKYCFNIAKPRKKNCLSLHLFEPMQPIVFCILMV